MFVNPNDPPVSTTATPARRGPLVGLVTLVALLALASMTGAQPAQSITPVTEARVRALAKRAQADAKADATALVLALDRQVRDTWGEFESFPISVVRREDLLVTLSSPYMSYRRALVDALRTKRPIDGLAWVGTAVLSVSPARLSSPDVERVVLMRNGREIPPLKDGLRPMTFSNGSGEQGTLHAGDIHWPMSAFAPGAAVAVTLHGRSGNPLVYDFSDAELTTLK